MVRRKIKTFKQVQQTLFKEIQRHLPDSWADQVDLAEKADVSAQTIWMWEKGYTVAPRITTLTKVALALGYNLELVRIVKPKLKLVH